MPIYSWSIDWPRFRTKEFVLVLSTTFIPQAIIKHRVYTRPELRSCSSSSGLSLLRQHRWHHLQAGRPQAYPSTRWVPAPACWHVCMCTEAWCWQTHTPPSHLRVQFQGVSHRRTCMHHLAYGCHWCVARLSSRWGGENLKTGQGMNG